MDRHPRSDVARRLCRVEFLGVQLGLLGQIASERGVRIVATHGMPNNRIENRMNASEATLIYTPRMPADAEVRLGRASFRSPTPLNLATPGCSYKLRGGGAFTSAYCVLSPSFLADLSETESRLRIGALNLAGPIGSERLTYLGQAMLREAIAPGFGGGIFAEAMGIAVAVEVARLDGARGLEDAPRRGGLASWQMNRLESYIRDRVSDKLTLRELALLVGVSVRRLSEAIKQRHGVSLHRWIAERRVAEARRLLIETDLPLDEVARCCAFQSAAAFAAAFRAAAGLAPAEFRRLSSDRS
jgi:AraC family transcriptional regulator